MWIIGTVDGRCSKTNSNKGRTINKSLLSSFDEEYKRLEFSNDSYKVLPDDIKQNLYEYVVLKKPLSSFLRAICINDLGQTMRYSDEEKDKLIRKIFLWFWNVCPSNMYGLKNYQEFESEDFSLIRHQYIQQRKYHYADQGR